MVVVFCLILIVPSISLMLFINRHIYYRGEETPKYALQGIYKAEEYGLEETVHIYETSDGEKLWCSEINAEKPKGIIIYLTGIAQPSITYFYGHAAWMQKEGYTSFLLEVRGHGESSGKQIGFGYTEIEDVKTVVNAIKDEAEYEGLPIILQGVSMGGAITLNAFGQIPEISGCIAMSPYASVENEIDLLMKQYHVPEGIRKLEIPVIRQTLKWIYGSEAVENLKPDKQIQNANGRPVYIVSCREDDSVPVENTALLAETYPEAEVWIRNSWEHFVIKQCDFRNVTKDEEYCQKILEWITQITYK